MVNRPRCGGVSERFWSKVNTAGNDCWEWTASLQGRGYGAFWLRGKMENAQRVAWELENGSIPDGLFVLHRCDNKKCVRPSHLFLGSASDNQQDSLSKGTFAVGERNGQSALTEEAVSSIRKSDKSLRALAAEYGVHNSTILRAKNGTHWKR